VREQDAARRERVDVRGFDVRVPAERPDPRIQIVGNDQKNVRWHGLNPAGSSEQ
jgi:hypothetical protein